MTADARPTPADMPGANPPTRANGTPAIPTPDTLQPPRPAPLTRDQYIRKFCLEAAIRYHTSLAESHETEVLATARTWAEWIRTGQHPKEQ